MLEDGIHWLFFTRSHADIMETLESIKQCREPGSSFELRDCHPGKSEITGEPGNCREADMSELGPETGDFPRLLGRRVPPFVPKYEY